jgi:hypothetical protein
MTKTQAKREAQDRLLYSFENALMALDENHDHNFSPTDKAAVRGEIKKQAKRVAKLFGYSDFNLRW